MSPVADSPPVCDLEVERHVAVLTLSSPPVNALGQHLCQGLHDGLTAAMAHPDVRAVVVICAGRTFCAGAEINELGKELQGPGLLEILQLLDEAPKPVVAAMHGTALGGGLELALACHYRVAVPSARVGLPEVALGLLPGGGGTQRLPRIVGIPAALELIALGKTIDAGRAHELGILDALVAEDSLRAASIGFAEHRAGRGLPRVRDRRVALTGFEGPAAQGDHVAVLEQFRREHTELIQGFKAPESILRAIEAAATLPFDEGMQREAELFQELLRSPESAAQRYVFFAERAASKVPDVTSDTAVPHLRTVGLICSAEELKSLAGPLIAAGSTVIHVLVGTAALPDHTALDGCDLIIQTGLAPLAGAVPSEQARRVMRWHFFAPVGAPGAMRLLEITRTAQTDPQVVVGAMRLARTLEAIAVLSTSGSIARRMQKACEEAARTLERSGFTREQIAAAAGAFGLPTRLFGLHAQGAGQLPVGDAGIIEQLHSLVAAEGERLLGESVALRSSDIDIVMIRGHGWPVYRGGPMWWAARNSPVKSAR